MTIPGDNPLAYQGVKAQNPPNLVLAQRAPNAQDISHDLGSFWLNEATDTMYVLVDISAGAATWDALGGGAAGIDTINGVAPAAGDFTLAGTANQITATNGASTVTFSLPAAITTPGSLTTTTSLSATTTVTAGTGISSTTGDITADAGDIVATAGNIYATAGSLSAGTTVTAGTGISATTGDITAVAGNIVSTAGNITATAGSVSAGTTVTGGTGVVATTGDVTSTAGNLVATVGNLSLPGAGAHTEIEGGAATDFIGTATLAAGTVTVAHTGITAADRIMVTRSDINGSTALGVFEVVKTPSTNFVINARNPADGTIQTNDVSVVEYVITRQL